MSVWFKNKKTGLKWEISDKDTIRNLKADPNFKLLNDASADDSTSISNYTTRESDNLINECTNIKKLETWLQEERKGKQRKTIVEKIAAQIEQLEEDDS